MGSLSDAKNYAEAAEKAVSEGYDAVKIAFFTLPRLTRNCVFMTISRWMAS